MEDKFIKGTPPLVLMPAKNYIFKIDENNYMVKLPRKGKYHDLAPDIFDEESGEFNILDEDTKILYLPAITKVLFATSKYPDLKFNQFWVPYSIKFEEEEIIMVGQVIEMFFVKEDTPNQEPVEEK